MFRATFCPSSGALLNCSRSLRFPYKSRGGCVSSRGMFVTNNCYCSTCFGQHFAHHQERFWTAFAAYGFLIKAEVLVTNRPRLETHRPRLLYGNRRLRLQFKNAPDDGQNVARNMLSSIYTTKQKKVLQMSVHLVGCFIWINFLLFI
jgi:hypothetical protein